MARYALVIGVSRYVGELPSLSKPAKDAESFATLLEQYGNFQSVKRLPAGWIAKEQREVVHPNKSLTGKELGQALQTFLLEQADGQDALIYFSGHGIVTTDPLGQKEGYLAASDCHIELDGDRVIEQQYGLPLDSFNRLIRQARLSSLVVVLDSCYSGYFIDRSLTEQTLTAFSAGQDYFLMSASRAFEQAYEGAEYSIFTQALLDGLAQQYADSNGQIACSRLFDHVYSQLRGLGQEPFYMGGGRSIALVTYPISQLPSPTAEPKFQPDKNPYLGLRAFEQRDQGYFYGRERAVRELLSRLTDNRFLAIIGPSGCGKSSLVKAGLLPELNRDGVPGSSGWAIDLFTPGEYPLVNLESVINRPRSPDQPLLIVIDQLEELFTLAQEARSDTKPPETIQWQFFHRLADLVTAQEPLIRIVVAIRVDFLNCCNPYPDAVKLLNRAAQSVHILNQTNPSTYFVPPLDMDELEAAIEKPALQHGVIFEHGLPSIMAADVWGQPGALPLLQYALAELWETCVKSASPPQQQILRQGYDRIGGVKGALDQRATLLYKSCPPDDQQLIQTLFTTELINLGEGETVTRRRANLNDLRDRFAQHSTQFERVLRLLSGQEQRLIVTNEETLEVAHEALLTHWTFLTEWIEQERENIRMTDRLRSACKEWEDSQKEDGYLLDGKRLRDIDEWVKNTNPALASGQAELLQKSREKRDRESQKEVRLYRGIAGGAIASLLLIAGFAGVAAVKWRAADQGQIQALFTASQAQFVLNRNTFDALIEGLKAGRQLQQSLWLDSNSPLKAEVMRLLSAGVYWTREYNRLEGHQNFVQSVSFSPDGELIATASFDGTAKVWQADGKLLYTLEGHTQPVVSVSFSPDNSIIATASLDGTVKLWNRDGKLVSSLESQTGPVRSVSFSPDGQTIATAGDDGLIKLWTREGKFLKDLRGQTDGIYSVRFSPDGQAIASANQNKTAILWDLKSGQIIHTLAGHQDLVYSVSFSPDGKTIATASHDGTVMVWDRATGTRQHTLRQTGKVNDVEFSPDGKTIATASADGTVKLWDQSGLLLSTIEGHQGSVNSISFSPDGTALASASNDSTVKLWRLNSLVKVLARHNGSVWNVAFSPDGQLVATAGADNVVNLLQYPTGESLKPLEGRWVSFSPDSQIIATIVGDSTIKLWDHRTSTLLPTSVNHKALVTYLAFSPDGQTFATTAYEGTVKLWNLKGELQRTLKADAPVFSVGFSSDGQNIATGDERGTVILWNRDGTRRLPIKAHDAQIFNIQFAPNDNRFVTVSGDKTAKIWDQNGQLLHSFGGTDGHTAGISGVSFSPSDGHIIATASDDRTVKLWTQEGQLITTLLGHSGPVNSVSFSRDGNTLLTASSDQTVLLWPNIKDLSIDNLLLNGCDWLRDYLSNNPNAPHNVCQL